MALLDQIKSYFDQLKPETNLTLPGGFSGFGQSLSNYFTPDNLKAAFQPKEKKGFFQRAKEKITDFFKPAPEVRARDVLREIIPSTQRGGKKVAEFAKEALQFTARTGGSTFLTLKQLPSILRGEEPKPEEIQAVGRPFWEQVAARAIFGDEPVKDWATRIAEGEQTVKSLGRELQQSAKPLVKSFGEKLEKGAFPISGLGLPFIAALDFTGVGKGGRLAVVEALKVANKTDDALRILTRIGVPEDLARPAAEKFAQITDRKLISQGLDKIEELARTTRQVAPEVGAVARQIPPDLQPLAQEAKKYKSVEEFVKSKSVIFDTSQPNVVKRLTDIYDQAKGQPSDILGTRTSRAAAQREAEAFVKQMPGGGFFEGGGIPTAEREAAQLRAMAKIKALQTKDLQPLAQEARKYKSAEDLVTTYKKAMREWKPIEGDFEITTVKTKDTNFFPSEKFLSDDFRKSKSVQFWVDKLKKGEPLEPIIVEPAKSFKGIFIRDGIHRAVAAEIVGIEDIPVLFLKKSSDKLTRNFTTFSEKELDTLLTKSQLTDFYNQVKGEVKPTAPTPPSGAIPPKPPIKPPTLPEPQIPEAKETISKLIKAIDEAVPLRGEQKKLYQAELAKRTARVAAAGEKVPGEAGFFAQLGQLKGPLPKAQFEAVRKLFSQTEVDLLFNSVEQTKTLLPLEKVSTKEGLRKLFEGAVPTPSEISHLREVFPKELIDSILARRPILDKFKDAFGEIWNLSRTMMATLDLSAPFRQGVFMLGRPIRFAQAFKDMFKFAVSEKAYVGLMDGIKARPTYLKMKQGRLALTEIGGPLLKREERFMSNLAEKIPGYGALVRASNRAYTGFLNKLRADIFDDILTKAKVLGRDVDEPLLQSIADFVNAGTGRGKFGFAETGIIPKSMERAAVVLNGAFFSPRLMASRLNLLNPYFYVHLDPLVRKEAIKTLFGTAGILGSVYGLWKLNGGEVGIDPRSADFGKIKIGNTRYDILGGFQQYVKLAAQLITGEVVSSTTGRTITLGEGYKPLTRKEIVLRFFENKTSPIVSFLIGLMTGQTATGEDVDAPTEIINRFLPMVVQDLYDISQEKGAEGLLYGLPAIFGAGVQTYGRQELVVGESRLGEETAQVRPVPELAEKIRELVMGQIPLGASKSFSIETYFDQLSNLPKDQAADIFDQISKTNPDLAKQIIKVVKEREKGITVKDKDLKAKGVASGDRTLAVKKELDKLKTPEEKAVLWDEYVRKGIITKKVAEQLTKIINQ